MRMNNANVFKNHIYGANLCKKLYMSPRKNAMLHYNKKDRDLYVVLQGTNTIYHWIHNFSLLLTKDEGIHTGFKKHAELCKNELLDDILVNKCLKDIESFDEIDNVYFTAHSLGASAILILVYELLKQKYFYLSDINVDIVLFGSPKSGNDQFNKEFNKLINNHNNVNIYRYNLKYDLIQYFPPMDMYSHVCDDIILENEEMEIKQVFNNHSINSYINQLEIYYLAVRKNKIIFDDIP